MKDDTRDWVALNMVGGIGAVRFSNLLRAFESPALALNAGLKSIMSVEGFNRNLAERFIANREKIDIDNEMDYIEKMGVRILTIREKEYPGSLKALLDPPQVLYAMGKKLSEKKTFVAIVGTREPSSYGKRVAEYLAQKLSDRGLVIVSGFARGIDSVAHRGAMGVGGETVAVMGCGLAVDYPASNRGLKEKMAESGTLLSEFSLFTKPDRMNFPMRNRIISGMSLGTIVVEAAEKSGSLITANLAAEQGREVFAVPGSIFSPVSRGTNALIRDGAKIVRDPDDILEEIRPFLEKEKNIRKLERGEVVLSPGEKKVYEILGSEGIHIDRVSSMAGMPVSSVAAILLTLELRKLVTRRPGQMYRLAD